MKIDKNPAKLALSKETLQALAPHEAPLVAAAVGSGRFTFCAGCTLGGSCP